MGTMKFDLEILAGAWDAVVKSDPTFLSGVGLSDTSLIFAALRNYLVVASTIKKEMENFVGQTKSYPDYTQRQADYTKMESKFGVMMPVRVRCMDCKGRGSHDTRDYTGPCLTCGGIGGWTEDVTIEQIREWLGVLS